LAVLILAGAGCSVLQQNNTDTKAAVHSDTTKPRGELLSGGEADPARMTLTMKEWTWIRTLYNNDTTVVPSEPGAFTLDFGNDGKLAATTDCNRMMGSYTSEGNTLSFSQLASTRMYCTDSQEDQFAGMLANVASFLFTPKGELVLELKFDSGHILLK